MSDNDDHTRYRDEVERRWGAQAYRDGDRWWRGLDEGGKSRFREEHAGLALAWHEARTEGWSADDPRVQQIAQRHAAWISTGWGGRPVSADALRGLAQMYVDDERFAVHYGGADGARYVRDGLVAQAEHL